MNDTKIKLQDIYNRLDALFDEDGDWHTLVKKYETTISDVLDDLYHIIEEYQ